MGLAATETLYSCVFLLQAAWTSTSTELVLFRRGVHVQCDHTHISHWAKIIHTFLSNDHTHISLHAEYLPAAYCPDFVIGRGVERGSAVSESVYAPGLGVTVLSAGCSQTPEVLNEKPHFVQREGMLVGHGLVGNKIPL